MPKVQVENGPSLTQVVKLGFVGALIAAAGRASYEYLYPINTCSLAPVKNYFSYGGCSEIFSETSQKNIDDLRVGCKDEISLSRLLEEKIYAGEGDDVRRILAACPSSCSLSKLRTLIYMGELESIQFIIENGLLQENIDEHTICEAVEQADSVVLKLLMPLANEKSMKAGLVEAARLGRIGFIRTIVLGAIDVSSAVPSALSAAAKNGHLSSVKFLAKNQHVDMSHLEQALIEAAKAGHPHVVRYLCKEYPVSQDTLNTALQKAAFIKHKDTFTALVKGGANFFSSEVSVEYGAEIEMLPREEEIFSLSIQNQFKFFAAHINKQSLSPSMLRIFQNAFGQMTQDQKGFLLENLLAHQALAEETVQWVIDQMVDISDEYRFKMARLALLKDSDYKAFYVYLNDEHKNALKKWEGRVAIQKQEEQELKASILKAAGESSLRPSRKEWQEEVEKRIESHRDRIIALATRQIEEGIHVYKDFPGQVYIASLDEFPGLIFKIFPKLQKEHRDKYERATQALEVCEKEGLNRLRIPYSMERLIEVGDQYVFIEEKLEVLDRRPDYQARVQFMSRDPELSEILRQTFEQATIFISRTGWYDTRYNNGPLLKDGSGMGLVDIDRIGAHPMTGLYRFQPGSALIDSVHDPEILRKVLFKMDFDRFRDFDFAKHEKPRYQLLACQKRQREVLLKRGLMDYDPIPLDPLFFEGLSPFETKFAKALIDTINRKLHVRECDGEPRGVFLDLRLVLRQPEFDLDRFYSKNGEFDFTFFEKVIEHFLEKEVIFYKHEYGAHSYQFLI